MTRDYQSTIDWVKCPVCGESQMRRETDREGDALIDCVNHSCFSNGGTNMSELVRSVAKEEMVRLQLQGKKL